VFGTGTFSGSRTPSDRARVCSLFAFMRGVARLSGIHFHRLVWASRDELGEIGGRAHYHWLIGSDDWQPSVADMFRLNHLWGGIRGCGFSRNHLFNAELNGVDYVTKCMSGSALGGTVGGDYYESSKFSLSGSKVTLSNALVRVVGGRRVSVLRH